MSKKIGHRRVFGKILNSKRYKALLDRRNLLDWQCASTRGRLGCFRSLHFKLWAKWYIFLVYSRSMVPVFFLLCILFTTTSISLWHKTGKKAEKHNNTSTHKENMSKLENFEAELSNPDLTIPFSFDNQRQQRIENNTEILVWVIEVIIICGKQCLPWRAHRNKTPDTNSGNFLAILRLLGKKTQTLKKHLNNSIVKNAQ